MSGLIIIDNNYNEEEEATALDENCGVCVHPDTEKTDLQKIFNLFEKETDAKAIKSLYNDKICQYHKERFKSLKIFMNKAELYEYNAKDEKVSVARPITEEEYEKEEPAEEDEEVDPPMEEIKEF